MTFCPGVLSLITGSPPAGGNTGIKVEWRNGMHIIDKTMTAAIIHSTQHNTTPHNTTHHNPTQHNKFRVSTGFPRLFLFAVPECRQCRQIPVGAGKDGTAVTPCKTFPREGSGNINKRSVRMKKNVWMSAVPALLLALVLAGRL